MLLLRVTKSGVIVKFFIVFTFFLSVVGFSADKPNFVFFIADDLGFEDLGTYGHPVIKTPHIDQLATDGMKFTNAYLTISSCSPSRCSIISGRYPHNTGAAELHTNLPVEQVKFPQLLKESGYYSVISGKHHIGNIKNAFNKISKGKGPGLEEDWVPILEKRPKDKPFFMWFSALDAHKKFEINDKAPIYDPKDVIIPPYMVDGPEIRKEFTGYYHEISRFDYYIGEVVKELKKQEVFDNTFIIVMSDNGRPFTRAKTRLYDSGIKTPFIVHYSKMITQGVVTDSLISSIDVASTIVELAGLKADERIQGVSFTPIIKDPKTTVREVVFAEHNWHVNQAHERMVRMGDFLYIKNNFPNQKLWCVEASYKELDEAFKEGTLNAAQSNVFRNPCPEEELYHVGKDFHQLNNVINNPEYKEMLKKMRQQLADWTVQTGDNVPKNPSLDRGAPGTKKGERNPHREMPGKETGAEKINHKGPIKVQ